MFPKNIPLEIYNFCRSFAELSSPANTAWFLSYLDYTERSDSAFAWNEFKSNDLSCAIDDAQKVSVIKFWEMYFPFAMSVKDDHQFIAIGINDKNLGRIYCGENSDEGDIYLLANNLSDFVSLVSDVFRENKGSPLSFFLN